MSKIGIVLLAALAMGASGLVAPASAHRDCPLEARVRVSDGKTLGGCIYLPEGKGPFPAILFQSPYGAADHGVRTYNDEGYAHVNIDVRGTGESEGALCTFCEREAKDAAEVVEWIAKQKWSDGNVGMMGGSYPGITALRAASLQPPHLRAIVPSVVISDAYRDAVWHNGIYSYLFMGAYEVFPSALGATRTGENNTPQSFVDDLQTSHVLTETYTRPFDGPFYRERSIYPDFDQITVPTLLTGGWFDGLHNGTVHVFQGIAAEHKRLIMEPAGHKGQAGGLFEPSSEYRDHPPPPGPEDTTLAWFDRFLKGERNGIEKRPAMTYYDLGSDKWQTASSWPPPASKLDTFYLSGRPSGSAPSFNDGSLVAKLSKGDLTKPDSYVYEPTSGYSDTFSRWGEVGIVPQVRTDQRADDVKGLTYTTPEMKKPLEIAGSMELRFWAETTARDTDWIVKVTDVSPDGKASLRTYGFLKASHREVDEELSAPAEPWIANLRALEVKPGKATLYRIPIAHTALSIMPGHRLRISISSSDSPNHLLSPYPGVNTILHDSKHPSQLIVTVR